MNKKPKKQEKIMNNTVGKKAWLFAAINEHPIALFGLISLLCPLLFTQTVESPVIMVMSALLLALLMVGAGLYLRGGLTTRRCVMLLIFAGFLLRLLYVLYTPVSMRQHDVWHFTDGTFSVFDNCRHAEYIEYIATYLALPQIDPVDGLSQLYHPPFHHLIAGLWLRLQVDFGVAYATACENIQWLTLFYSTACMVIVYRLLKLLGCKKWNLILPMAVICFHPTFVIMAGSVNNDLLSITLGFYAVYAAVRWYQKPTMHHILTVAFGVGLSMMTKLSGGLVAPGIAVIFLAKWISAYGKKDGSFQKIFGQFLLFGVVCVPLGLWWQVKNLLYFGTPLTYVPALSERSGQYIGAYSVGQRLFSQVWESISGGFIQWQDKGAAFNEYNPLLALLKTSVFGEYTLFENGQSAVCGLLFFFNCLLAGLSLYAGVRCVIRYRKSPVALGLAVIWLTVFVSYVQFCFAYPQVCTQNFRYAVPTLLCGVVALGVYAKDSSPLFRRIFGNFTGMFCLSSMFCYLLLGLMV
jgi:hypothetical protein